MGEDSLLLIFYQANSTSFSDRLLKSDLIFVQGNASTTVEWSLFLMKRTKNLLKSRITHGVVGSAAVKASNMLIGMLGTVLLSRFLGPTSFGIYALVIVVVHLMGIPLNVGLRTLLIRETARLQQGDRWAELHGLLRRAFQLLGGYSVLCIIVGGVTLLAFRGAVAQHAFHAYTMALLLFPLLGLLATVGGILTGLRLVVWGQFPDLVLRPMVLVVILLALHAAGFGESLTAQGAVVAAEIAAACAVAFAIAVLANRLPQKVRHTEPVYHTRFWLRSLLPFSLIAGIGVIQTNMDILMLGALKSHEVVGQYRVATQAAVLVGFALQAVNMVISPYVARLYAAGEMDQLQRLMRRSALAIVAMALPISLLYLLYAESLIGAIFGDSYRPAAATLVILSLGQLLNAAMGPVGLLLNMTGHERYTVAGTVIAATLNGVLNLPLILTFGMEGAAFATAISLAVWNLFLVRCAGRKLGIVTYPKLF